MNLEKLAYNKAKKNKWKLKFTEIFDEVKPSDDNIQWFLDRFKSEEFPDWEFGNGNQKQTCIKVFISNFEPDPEYVGKETNWSSKGIKNEPCKIRSSFKESAEKNKHNTNITYVTLIIAFLTLIATLIGYYF